MTQVNGRFRPRGMSRTKKRGYPGLRIAHHTMHTSCAPMDFVYKISPPSCFLPLEMCPSSPIVIHILSLGWGAQSSQLDSVSSTKRFCGMNLCAALVWRWFGHVVVFSSRRIFSNHLISPRKAIYCPGKVSHVGSTQGNTWSNVKGNGYGQCTKECTRKQPPKNILLALSMPFGVYSFLGDS